MMEWWNDGSAMNHQNKKGKLNGIYLTEKHKSWVYEIGSMAKKYSVVQNC